jgi:hypothetical protein
MIVQELIDTLEKCPKSAKVVADSIIGGCFLAIKGETATGLVDMNLEITAEASEEAVDLNPLCFVVEGLVEQENPSDDEVRLLLRFEHGASR